MTDIVRDPYGNPLSRDKLIAALRAEVERLKVENEAVLSANRDVMLHWDVLKADYDRLRAALHRISLGSQNSMTSKAALGKEARAALEEKP